MWWAADWQSLSGIKADAFCQKMNGFLLFFMENERFASLIVDRQ